MFEEPISRYDEAVPYESGSHAIHITWVRKKGDT